MPRPKGIDILCGLGVFVEAIHHGWRYGPRGSPTAVNTDFGWVLAGDTCSQAETGMVTTHLTSVLTGDDLLRWFLEVEVKTIADCSLTVEDRRAVQHFNSYHSRDPDGRFVVPLPKRSLMVNSENRVLKPFAASSPSNDPRV